MSSIPARGSTLTRIATVLFSASLLGGYVWYASLKSETVAPPAAELAQGSPEAETSTEVAVSRGTEEGGGEFSGGVARPQTPSTALMLSSKSSGSPVIAVPEINIKLNHTFHGLDFLKKPAVPEIPQGVHGIKVEVTSAKGDLDVKPDPPALNLPSAVPAAQSISERNAVARHQFLMGSSKSGTVKLPEIDTSIFLNWLGKQEKAPATSKVLDASSASSKGSSSVIAPPGGMPPHPSLEEATRSETLKTPAERYPLEMPVVRTLNH